MNYKVTYLDFCLYMMQKNLFNQNQVAKNDSSDCITYEDNILNFYKVDKS